MTNCKTRAIIESENKPEQGEARAEATEEDTETPRPARRPAAARDDEFDTPLDVDMPKKGPAKKTYRTAFVPRFD